MGITFLYSITDRDISKVDIEVTHNIVLTSNGGSNVVYDEVSKTFRGNSLSAGLYKIKGVISDVDGVDSSKWSFDLLVQARERINDSSSNSSLGLSIPDQTIEVGQRFIYTMQARDLRGASNMSEASINITSDGGSSVIFKNIFFLRRTAFNAPGNYVIRGTITNSRGSAPWSFNLMVKAKTSRPPLIYPTLNIPNQSIEAGQSFSYTIKTSDISGVTSVSEATIRITSDGGSGVTFNNIAFVRRTVLDTLGNYVIRGTITNSRGSAPWSFNLMVRAKLVGHP